MVVFDVALLTAFCSAWTLETLTTVPLGAGRGGAESGERARVDCETHDPGRRTRRVRAAASQASGRVISAAPPGGWAAATHRSGRSSWLRAWAWCTRRPTAPAAPAPGRKRAA